MTDKLDILFSPDRLRSKWLNKKNTEHHDQRAENSLRLNKHAILYMKVMESINDRFSGDDLELLRDLMHELEKLLNLRFNSTNESPCPLEEMMKINLAIDEILINIEDIV